MKKILGCCILILCIHIVHSSDVVNLIWHPFELHCANWVDSQRALAPEQLQSNASIWKWHVDAMRVGFNRTYVACTWNSGKERALLTRADPCSNMTCGTGTVCIQTELGESSFSPMSNKTSFMAIDIHTWAECVREDWVFNMLNNFTSRAIQHIQPSVANSSTRQNGSTQPIMVVWQSMEWHCQTYVEWLLGNNANRTTADPPMLSRVSANITQGGDTLFMCSWKQSQSHAPFVRSDPCFERRCGEHEICMGTELTNTITIPLGADHATTGLRIATWGDCVKIQPTPLQLVAQFLRQLFAVLAKEELK